jgi:endonuclease-3
MDVNEFLSFIKELEQKVPLDAYVSYFSKNIKNKEERIFKVTISTILSARTKDEVTAKVSERLFKKVKNWQDLEKISLEELEKLIYGVGFYKNKAKLLKKLAEEIRKRNYKFPEKLEEITKLPGIGTKTANIILTEGLNSKGLAVDTHVHRIVNRLELVDTWTPEETEKVLKSLIPKEYWNKVNALLVSFGRQICNVKPKCEICFFKERCPYYKKLTKLKQLLKNHQFKKLTKKEIENLDFNGSYILKIYLKDNTKIKNWKLKKGYYFYVGSAKKNMKQRLLRHLSNDKKLFWHIDYLLTNKKANLKEIYATKLEVEKEVAKEMSSFLKAVEGFGNSDDKENKSHLFYLQP